MVVMAAVSVCTRCSEPPAILTWTLTTHKSLPPPPPSYPRQASAPRLLQSFPSSVPFCLPSVYMTRAPIPSSFLPALLSYSYFLNVTLFFSHLSFTVLPCRWKSKVIFNFLIAAFKAIVISLIPIHFICSQSKVCRSSSQLSSLSIFLKIKGLSQRSPHLSES